MRTTIDAAGRLVIPKAMRDRLALGAGGEVEVVERGGVIEIQSVPVAVEITLGPGGPVAASTAAVPPLTDDDVLATRDALRR